MTTVEEIGLLVSALGRGKVLEDYIVPGLRSTELARLAAGGMIRLFEMSHEQEFFVVPHDHRFGFNCYVLRGTAWNTIYHVREADCALDQATHAAAPYLRSSHSLDLRSVRLMRCELETVPYGEGSWYSMEHSAFHTIEFTKDARVLFIEGPEEKSGPNSCLLPVVNGKIYNTFFWGAWMMREAE